MADGWEHRLEASAGAGTRDLALLQLNGPRWECEDQNLAGLTWKLFLEEVIAEQDLNEERG